MANAMEAPASEDPSFAEMVATWAGNNIHEALGMDEDKARPELEVEIVFGQDVVEEDGAPQQQTPAAVSDCGDDSSEVVLAGDNYWDNLLATALQRHDEKMQSALDFLSSSSSASVTSSGPEDSGASSMDDESCSDGSNALNGWTDKTNPDILLGVVDSEEDTKRLPQRATVLSDKLWERDYKTVEARILSHPEEVSTMIDMPASQEPVQGFPLHLACAMRPLPPLSIVQLLLSVYPQAAAKPESQWNMLPLHFAANLSQQAAFQDDLHHVRLVETLLVAHPDARMAQELCQGRTPLHLAACSTVQTIEGMIPSTSHAILQLLLPPTMDDQALKALWMSDFAGDSAHQIARCNSSFMTLSSSGGVEAELGWKMNPLLQLTAPPSHSSVASPSQSNDSDKPSPTAKKLVEDEDCTSVTDVTSVTGSLSLGSFTSGATTSTMAEHPQHELVREESTCAVAKEEALAGGEEADDDQPSRVSEEAVSVSDDDTFFTARSHEQSTVQMDNRGEDETTSSRLSEASLRQLSSPVPKPLLGADLEDVESVLTEENDIILQPAVATDGLMSAVEQALAITTSSSTKPQEMDLVVSSQPFIPRAVQVEKVLLHLQIRVSDLVRFRKKTLANSWLPLRKRAINPYFEVELLHLQSDVSARLHQSHPYYRRREAEWDPVQFAIDASVAQSQQMVLAINLYHKKDKEGQYLADEWIGGHQASPWDLIEISPNEKIPLRREKLKTGKVRLISYQMEPMNKADCWRIYL